MASGLDLIIATLCNATLDGALNTTDLFSTLVPRESNRLERGGSADKVSFSALAKAINGKHLKIATYINLPISGVQPDPRKNGAIVGIGVAFIVLNILRDKFNFTYEVVQPRKNFVMGGSDPEDSLVGLVSTGKVDMAAAFVPNILEFRKYVSFSTALDEETWAMLMQRPAVSAVGEGLLAPFAYHVWYFILIALVLFGPCITILTRIRSNLMRDDEQPIPLPLSVWFVYGAFIKQGSNLAPKATSTRVLFTTWWLFVMVVSACYMANLTAFLTLSEFMLDIDRPIDLYLHNRPWVATEGSAIEFAVTSPQSEDTSMYYLNKMIETKRALFVESSNLTEFFRLVDKGYVLVKSYNSVVHSIYSDYLAKTKLGVPERKRCAYVIAPHPFLKNLRGFIYPKNSTLKSLFDRVLGIINQSGLVNLLKTRNLPSTRICPMDLQSKERKLQNKDLLITYMITICGMCTAIAVFIGEIIVKRHIAVKRSQKVKGNHKKTKFNRNATVHYYEDNDSQPPPYEAIFGQASKIKLPKNAHKKIVNGREYLVVNRKGGIRLVPVRTPSAFLYKVEKFNK